MKRFFAFLGILVFFSISNFCLAANTGSIVAWGYNFYHQCVIPSFDSNFVAITAGSSHSMALRRQGSFVSWGWNAYDQAPPPASSLKFSAISGGGIFTVALTFDGIVRAAGDNSVGETNVPDSNLVYTAIAAGNLHALAVRSDGSVFAWGFNGSGQCDVPEPNSDFVSVAAGATHSLGLKLDGSIVAWGGNYAGQCDVPSPNKDFIAVSAGSTFSLGLKSNGSIVAWGDNNDRQCRVPAPNTGFVAIDAGAAHSLGLKANGSIRAWGDNTHHQLDVCSPNTNFIAVSAGSAHSLALRSPCDLPSRPKISASDGHYTDRIRVSWNRVSGAHYYEVWRSPYNIPASAVKLADSNSPFDDYNIPSDSKFYYWVKAVSPCGESFFSLSNSGYTSLNPTANDILIKKCTISADTSDINDSISISGLINADYNDINLANAIEVNISSDDLNIPCVQSFPVDSTTFKKGRFYSSKTIGQLKTSFFLDPKTSKFSFTAKNVDLSGLSAPFAIRISVGGFVITTDVNETLINGTRKSIPISLLMGLKDSLRIDRFNYHPGQSNTGSLYASGGFSLINPDANIIDSDLIISLNDQSFTIPANNLEQTKNGFSVSNLKLSNGSFASANFNFNSCAFTLAIQKATIFEVSDPAELNIVFGEVSIFDETPLP